MAEPTAKTIKRLFALSGNTCAFPRCTLSIIETAGNVTGEICHIAARSPGGPRYDPSQSDKGRNDFSNLLLLCRRHHKVVDGEPQIYTIDVLQDMKTIHERAAGRAEQPADLIFAKLLLNDLNRITISQNSGNIAINSPGAIQAHQVHVRTTRRSLSINAPPGTIGSDKETTRYVQYLIDRYNKFAGADRMRASKFSYGAISKNIESNFGAPWRLLPIEKFNAVCEYLQQRIKRTVIAKSNAAKGMRAYSTYMEFNTR
ncbi:HNH endonuclease signature motif containing protein [Nitrobacter sp.]|uniref:HNH endonuclease signature motif containing protein n=1 Tax=Nitrobacter sp. TaxID=29420 RepID=UPI003F64AD1F